MAKPTLDGVHEVVGLVSEWAHEDAECIFVSVVDARASDSLERRRLRPD
jgi:hypothetical protein